MVPTGVEAGDAGVSAAPRSSLAVLCPRGHAIHDTPQRIAMIRRTARRYGQLWLSQEIESAPFPPRTWPPPLRQMRLF